MEERIETRASTEKVWAAWERAGCLVEKKNGLRYKIIEVVPGVRFSILWKTAFVRLLFTHSVNPTKRGSEICYQVQIKGLFAWPTRWLLGNKIRQNVRLVLKSIVQKLEN